MKIKYKISLVLATIVLIFVAINVFIQASYILPAYKRIEERDCQNNIDLCTILINDKLSRVKLLCEDWSRWDDAYNFVKGINQTRFIKSSLSKTILDDTNLDILLFFNKDKKLIWSDFRKSIFKNTGTKNAIISKIKSEKLLEKNSSNLKQTITGLFSTPIGISLMAVSPIIHSDHTGPSAGTLIMASSLNIEELSEIENKLKIKLNIHKISQSNNYPICLTSNLKKLLSQSKHCEITMSKNILTTQMILNDISQNPSYLITVKMTRNVYLRAEKILYYSISAIIIIGIILLVAQTELIHFLVTNPLSKLTRHIENIKESQVHSSFSDSTNRNDEIGILTKQYNDMLNITQTLIHNMEDTIDNRTKEIKEARKETIFRLAMAVESRDSNTGKHIFRLSEIVKFIAKKYNLPDSTCKHLSIACSLHDIGKIGIPDNILNKKDKLTTEEIEIIKKHTVIGGKLLKDSNSKTMETAKEIAIYHHEKWDGTGYPYGLKKTDIPISARITSIADIIDALLSERPYKKEWSPENIKSYIKAQSGKIFDPKIAKIVLKYFDTILDIRKNFKS